MTSIVIRRGAGKDTVTVSNERGTVTVDQNELTFGQRHELRRQIVDVFTVERGLAPANDNRKHRPRRRRRRQQKENHAHV